MQRQSSPIRILVSQNSGLLTHGPGEPAQFMEDPLHWTVDRRLHQGAPFRTRGQINSARVIWASLLRTSSRHYFRSMGVRCLDGELYKHEDDMKPLRRQRGWLQVDPKSVPTHNSSIRLNKFRRLGLIEYNGGIYVTAPSSIWSCTTRLTFGKLWQRQGDYGTERGMRAVLDVDANHGADVSETSINVGF